MMKMTRPWGKWEVIDDGNGYKVKRLIVEPTKSISLQYHNHRSETWCVLQGQGLMILGDVTFTVNKGDTVVVPVKAKHKITCISNDPFIAIEVQLGEITEEDDIVRLD